MLSPNQLQDVCLYFDQSVSTCRYLRPDDIDPTKVHCLKCRRKEKQKIDEKCAEFVRDCKRKGIDPYTQDRPLGDNCPGYPVLKHILQGYDIP